MGDPVSAGVVGSVVAPAAAPTITGALATGMGAGSLFGFDPTIGGIGQGISEYFKTTPVFGQSGILANVGQGAGAYNQFNKLFGQPQQRMQPMGVNIRPGGQVAPVDYMSLLNPQQQTVIRPATPSLI